MVRSPCCEKMGLKKGPWTHEEDQILVKYIKLYGHGNWRALPKLAGLLRCGKSCRLRWTNYLNPDIKRGNFTREEEETIIQLHAAIGNRWSTIAAQLPGRTDNEIKNVWHTHLKKRVVHEPENGCRASDFQLQKFKPEDDVELSPSYSSPKPSKINSDSGGQTSGSQLNSPQHSYSEISSVNTVDNGDHMQVLGNLQEMDKDFWSEIISGENSGEFMEASYKYTSSMNDDMQFWLNVFTRGEELLEF